MRQFNKIQIVIIIIFSNINFELELNSRMKSINRYYKSKQILKITKRKYNFVDKVDEKRTKRILFFY
jgi:hypothetical protein